MKPMLSKIFIMSLVMSLWGPVVFAGEDARLYAQARKMANAGPVDFAFMQYQTILRDYPISRFTEPALFAQGEYYYMMEDYNQAKKAFETFLERYPQSKGKLFALAYLWRIAHSKNDEASAKNFEREMIAQKQV